MVLSSKRNKILLNEWKLKIVLSTKFLTGKKVTFFLIFWPKHFCRVSLLRKLSKENEKNIFLDVIDINIYGDFYIII